MRSFKFPVIKRSLSLSVCVWVVHNNMLNIKINTSRVKVIAFCAQLRRSSFNDRHHDRDHDDHDAAVAAAADFF